MKIWVLSTCIPDENEPCMPQVFVTKEAAEAAFEQTMRDEWDSYADWNDEGDGPVEWPGDAHKAHDIMAKTPEWGRWAITDHNIDAESSDAAALKKRLLSAIKPTYVPDNEHGVKPGYYTIPDIVRLLRKHHTNPKAVHFIADMME